MPNEISGAKLILQNTDGTEQQVANVRKAVWKDDGTLKVVTGTSDNHIEIDYTIVQQSTDSMKPQLITTQFGVLMAQVDPDTIIATLKAANIKWVRAQLLFSVATHNPIIDKFLAAGLNVQVNFNYLATSTPSPFPTDLVKVRSSFNDFATYYLPHKDNILVVVENEWNNLGYHSNDVSYYLSELSTIVDENKKFGYKIADAGITDSGIKQWHNGTQVYDTFINGIKSIGIDYLNFHWYLPNVGTKVYDIKTVAGKWMNACGKKAIISNEFGIFSPDINLFRTEVQGMKGFCNYAMAYSGNPPDTRAVTLTTDYLTLLQ